MAIYEIKHITTYAYDVPVSESINEIRLYPLSTPEQEIKSQELRITNTPPIYTFQDYWGNKTGIFNIYGAHQFLEIESRLKVATFPQNIPSLDLQATIHDLAAFTEKDIRYLELATPVHSAHNELLLSLLEQFKAKSTRVSSIISDAAFYVYQNLAYIKGLTSVETTLDEIIEKKGGVCQDFAHLLLEILRRGGIPCRYVSGYICSNNNQMRGEGATHAWVEAFIPEFGWAGIDPANNLWVTDAHVKLAIGRNFSDCTPVKGIFRGLATQSLHVKVSIGFEDGSVLETTSKVNEYEREGLTIPEIIEEKATSAKENGEQKQQ